MKRLIALALSILIMGIIFTRLDFKEFSAQVSQLNLKYFSLALFLFIPQILISAVRWKYLIKGKAVISLWESAQLILSASALNVFLPSKMGDLCKAYFMKREGRLDLKRGTNIVLFERYIDLASLSAIAALGVLFSANHKMYSYIILGISVLILSIFPILYFIDLNADLKLPFLNRMRIGGKVKSFLRDTQEYLLEIRNNGKMLLNIAGLSLFLWLLHLGQFYVVFCAIGAQVSLWHVFSLVALAIFVGLLPITIAGIGSRDAALVILFEPYAALTQIVFVGLFASVRYFVPGIMGVFFLNKYIVKNNAV